MYRVVCWIKAIPFFIRSGIWCPHIYMEVKREKAIIIATSDSFRVSNNLLHNANEKVYPKATLITDRCVCCGKKNMSWFDKEPMILRP